VIRSRNCLDRDMPHAPQHHRPSRWLGASRHGDQVYEVERRHKIEALAEAQRIRNSVRWRRVRAWVLAQEPLCRDIFGWHAAVAEIVLAREVDHVVRLVDRPDLAFDDGNLQPLCVECHARKSANERLSKLTR
jgi:5-methylcytosine-specific restriction endonuclease McrA